MRTGAGVVIKRSSATGHRATSDAGTLDIVVTEDVSGHQTWRCTSTSCRAPSAPRALSAQAVFAIVARFSVLWIDEVGMASVRDRTHPAARLHFKCAGTGSVGAPVQTHPIA